MLSSPLMAEVDALPTRAQWTVAKSPVPYPEAVACMEARVEAIVAGRAPEWVWLLEHPPIYTAGTSSRDSDLLDARFPVFKTGRGGQYTYHGPGQRLAYVMLDLKLPRPVAWRDEAERKPDVRRFVFDLETWLIATLAEFGVAGERREGRVGIWVREGGSEAKIASIGVRVRHWVTFHGVSLNVNPDLTHFAGIVPCGVRDAGVTSLAALGVRAAMADVDAALRRTFETVFGPVGT